MSTDRRYEYHVLRDRVVQVVRDRPADVQRWMYPRPEPTLIATFEADGPSFRVRPGPAESPDTLAQAAIVYRYGSKKASRKDLGRAIPKQLAKKLARRLASESEKLGKKYDNWATEPDMSAFLVGQWGDQEIRQGGWVLRTRAVTFNPLSKEGRYKADIGVVFVIEHEGVRTTKALWIQAKRSDELPDRVEDLPQLAGQIHNMLEFSNESYAAIYSRDGVHLFHGANLKKELSVIDVFFDCVVCRRADSDPQFVAIAGDSKLVLEIDILGPSSKRRRPGHEH